MMTTFTIIAMFSVVKRDRALVRVHTPSCEHVA